MKKLLKILQEKKSTHILVIGDIILDQYIVGTAQRLSPEAPVPVVQKHHLENRLGGAAQIALNCHIIGCEVDLIGVIGAHDSSGEKLCALLEQKNISLAGIVKSKDRSTTVKTRVMDQRHQLLRIDSGNKHALTSQECERVIQRVSVLMREDTTLLLSDNAKGVLSEDCIQTIIAAAHQRGCTIIGDPKGPHFLKYKGIHYLKLKEKEFSDLSSLLRLDPLKSMIENSRVACARLALDGIIIVRGNREILFISHDQSFSVPVRKQEVNDIAVFSDMILAYFAFGVSHRCGIRDTLAMANEAASLSASYSKTYAVSLEELLSYCDITHGKLCESWSELKIELDWLRREGKRVILAYGYFDVLHAGHVSMLHEARLNGDILVVALSSDISIKKNKGVAGLVNRLKDRVTVVAALDVVDFVVTFDEETPLELITYLKPDVLIKRGDYQAQAIIGYEAICAYGRKLKVSGVTQENQQ